MPTNKTKLIIPDHKPFRYKKMSYTKDKSSVKLKKELTNNIKKDIAEEQKVGSQIGIQEYDDEHNI